MSSTVSEESGTCIPWSLLLGRASAPCSTMGTMPAEPVACGPPAKSSAPTTDSLHIPRLIRRLATLEIELRLSVPARGPEKASATVASRSTTYDSTSGKTSKAGPKRSTRGAETAHGRSRRDRSALCNTSHKEEKGLSASAPNARYCQTRWPASSSSSTSVSCLERVSILQLVSSSSFSRCSRWSSSALALATKSSTSASHRNLSDSVLPRAALPSLAFRRLGLLKANAEAATTDAIAIDVSNTILVRSGQSQASRPQKNMTKIGPL
mmetsp:Transcript_59644/g.158710  ORF Transcript_59644/g.158710 Transcript_59644/m.158710 type:complete len:267 (-) Transcript_59644:10-810(-)